jgi:hypothetical protein
MIKGTYCAVQGTKTLYRGTCCVLRGLKHDKGHLLCGTGD